MPDEKDNGEEITYPTCAGCRYLIGMKSTEIIGQIEWFCNRNPPQMISFMVPGPTGALLQIQSRYPNRSEHTLRCGEYTVDLVMDES